MTIRGGKTLNSNSGKANTKWGSGFLVSREPFWFALSLAGCKSRPHPSRIETPHRHDDTQKVMQTLGAKHRFRTKRSSTPGDWNPMDEWNSELGSRRIPDFRHCAEFNA